MDINPELLHHKECVLYNFIIKITSVVSCCKSDSENLRDCKLHFKGRFQQFEATCELYRVNKLFSSMLMFRATD